MDGNTNPEKNLLSRHRDRDLWQELKNAIRGTDSDYTRIGLGRAMFLLGWQLTMGHIYAQWMFGGNAVIMFLFCDPCNNPRCRRCWHS